VTGDPGTPCRVAERFGEILLREEICKRKDERGVLILAHSGEPDAVRGTADVVGDDMALLRAAAASGARELVVCGPVPVAETIQLLLPDTPVIMPVPESASPPDPEVTPEDLRAARQEHPRAALVVGVRSPPEAKALADITCTPETIAAVIGSLEEDQVLLAMPGMDPDLLLEAGAGGKEILAVTPHSAAGAGGCHESGVCCPPPAVPAGDSGPAGDGVWRGAFFPRRCTNCHGMTETTLLDLYRSLVTGGPCVELPAALLSAARRPVLRMMDVLGGQP